MARLSPSLLLGLVALVGAGCGGHQRAASSVPKLPPCAEAQEPVDLPGDFPARFPLPEGTVITSSGHPSGAVTVDGVTPEEFRQAVAFFEREPPAAGFHLGEGDAEQGEAESFFSGRGYSGKWKVNGILNCPGAVTLTIAVRKL